MKLKSERALELFFDGKLPRENYDNGDCPITYNFDPFDHIVLDINHLVTRRTDKEKAYIDMLNNIKYVLVKRRKNVRILDTRGNDLFSVNEYKDIMSKFNGIDEYGHRDYKVSSNLDFDGISYFVDKVDSNKQRLEDVRVKIRKSIIDVFSKYNITCTFGANSGGLVEITEVGSTGRGTNLPSDNEEELYDFDFTLRVNPKIMRLVKKILYREFHYDNTLNGKNNKVRLAGLDIDGKKLDIDFALISNLEDYISCDQVIEKQLNNIKSQSEDDYKKVVANIMFAKQFFKNNHLYKILFKNRHSGIGGIGIETWILNNGGSFIDAVNDFLTCSRTCRNYQEFQKKYTIISPGENHNYRSAGLFGHPNFVNYIGSNNYYDLVRVFEKFMSDYKGKTDLNSMFENSNNNNSNIVSSYGY